MNPGVKFLIYITLSVCTMNAWKFWYHDCVSLRFIFIWIFFDVRSSCIVFCFFLYSFLTELFMRKMKISNENNVFNILPFTSFIFNYFYHIIYTHENMFEIWTLITIYESYQEIRPLYQSAQNIESINAFWQRERYSYARYHRDLWKKSWIFYHVYSLLIHYTLR